MPASRGVVLVAVTVSSQLSPAVSFSYSAPTVLSVTPGSASTLGGVVLTISGTSFDTIGNVTVGGILCPVVSCGISPCGYSHSVIYCVAPAGVGSARDVIVTQFSTLLSSSISLFAKFSYSSPTLTSIFPASAFTSGNTLVTVSGTNFGTRAQNASVLFGTATCSSLVVVSQTSITCILPAGQGSTAVSVTIGGQTSQSIQFLYSSPVISQISPIIGPTAGNILVTLSGLSFGLTPSVTIGGNSCPVVSSTHVSIICTLPSGAGVNQLIYVTVSSQTSLANVYFSYNGPTITSLNPSHAPASGNINLSVIGTNFAASGSSVTVGGRSCSVISSTAALIICLLPSGDSNNVPVLVASNSAQSAPFYFNYDAPIVTSITPSSGFTEGGSSVTITGTSFGLTSYVTIGGSSCTNPTVSFTQIVCNSPAGGGSGLVVVTSGSQSSTQLISFSYNPPLVTQILPNFGNTTGNFVITVNGVSFGPTGLVSLMSQYNRVVSTCTSISGLSSHASISCIVPAGQGLVTVIVTNGAQSSSTVGSSSNTFSYFSPVITSIAPLSGITSGGRTLTIVGGNFGFSGNVTVDGNACFPVIFYQHGRYCFN